MEAQIKVGMDASGVEVSAEKVKKSLSSIQNQIQRTTATLAGGEKGSRQFYEALANQRGVSVASLKPYLDQLDAAKMKAEAAAKATDGMKSAVESLGPKLAAVFSGAAIVGFASKLVSVQREFDVLNSSLITVTGSSANAAREMQWIKDFAKETPFGLAQATQGFVKMKALGLDPTRASLTSFGNTASAMGKDLNQMIEAVADASTGEFERLKEFGIKARKAGDEVSLTFQGVTTTIGNSAAEITGYLEKLGNVEFAGAMAERAKTLDGAISELADTWDELFRTINTNNAGGLIYDSIKLATSAITDATTILDAMSGAASENAKQTGAMAAIQSGIATVFETVAVVGANLKFVLVGIGNEIGGLAAQVGLAAQFNFAGVRSIREQMIADSIAARKEIDATTARILGARDAAKEFASYNTRNASAATDPRRLDAPAAKPTPRTTGGGSGSAAKAIKAEIDEASKAVALYNDILAKAAGYNANFTESVTALAKAYQLTSMTAEEYKAALDEILGQQPGAQAAAKALKDASAAADKYIDSLNKSADAVEGQLQKLQDEEKALLLSASANITLAEAIAEVEIARLREAQAVQLSYGNDVAAQAIQREIDARRELAQSINSKDAREAAKKGAEKAADEWQKTADKINDTLTDALMRGFEDGKDFAKNMRDTIVNMFKTMVLRPVISAIVNPVAGALTGALGFSGAAQAGGGGSGAGGLISIASNLSTVYNGINGLVTLGGQVVAGTMSAANALGTIAANATGSGITGLLATNGAYGTAAAGSASSFGASALAAAPYVLGAFVVANALGLFKKTKRVDGGISATLGDDSSYQTYDVMRKGGSLFSGPKYSENFSGNNTTISKVLNQQVLLLKNNITEMAASVGIVAGDLSKYSTSIKFSTQGLSGEQIQAHISGAFETLSEDIAKDLLGTKVSVTDTVTEPQFNYSPSGGQRDTGGFEVSYVEKQVERLEWRAGPFIREGESAIDALTRMSTSIRAANSALSKMGDVTFNVSLAGADAASRLVDAFGGLENMTQRQDAYYQAFYSEEERMASARVDIAKGLALVGVAMPASKEAFRDIVTGLDLTTESGRNTYAVMLALAPEFDSVAASAAAAAVTMRNAWAGVLQARNTPAGNVTRFTAQASVDSAFAEFIKTPNVGINSAEQFLTISQEDFSQYTVAQQQLISTILIGYGDIARAHKDTVKTLGEEAYASLERSVAAERNIAEASLSAAEEAVGELATLLSTLKGAVQSLYGLVESVTVMQADEGQAFISQALATARVSGYMPDSVALSDAVAGAMAGVNGSPYASQVDADFARLVLAGQLSELQSLGGAQLTEAEKALLLAEDQLDTLDNVLQTARDQLDALYGIDTSVLSLASEMEKFNATLVELRKPPPPPTSSTKAPGVFSGVQGPGAKDSQTNVKPTDAVIKDYLGQVSYDAGREETQGNVARDLYARYTAVDVTQADIARVSGKSLGDVQFWFDALGVNRFASGGAFTNGVVSRPTNFNMGQMGEAGPEAIMPLVNINGSLGVRSAGGDNSRLEALVEGLTKEVQRLQSIVNDGNQNTRRTADTLDNVTEGGSNMRTLTL